MRSCIMLDIDAPDNDLKIVLVMHVIDNNLLSIFNSGINVTSYGYRE